MIPTSAMSSMVKRAAKSQKVVCTEATSIFEMAAKVGMMSWITHG